MPGRKTRQTVLSYVDTQAELDTALKKKCQEQYDNGIDKPSVTISINMVALQNTEEYQDYKVLEEVSLGDTVHCKSSNLGIVYRCQSDRN